MNINKLATFCGVVFSSVILASQYTDKIELTDLKGIVRGELALQSCEGTWDFSKGCIVRYSRTLRDGTKIKKSIEKLTEESLSDLVISQSVHNLHTESDYSPTVYGRKGPDFQNLFLCYQILNVLQPVWQGNQPVMIDGKQAGVPVSIIIKFAFTPETKKVMQVMQTTVITAIITWILKMHL